MAIFFTDFPPLNNKIRELYSNILGAYWDKERRWVEEAYRSIPFPFEPMWGLDTIMSYTWDMRKLEGYVRTWSSLQHFIGRNGNNPVDSWIAEAADLAEGDFMVHFPVSLKTGRV